MALRRGDTWPSVTEILDLAGLTDYSKVPSSLLKAAAERGKEIHSWTEMIDAGRMRADQAPPLIEPYLQAYESFKRECDYEVILYEHRVYNVDWDYDGDIDRIARIDGHRSVLDVKTVAVLQPSTALQTSGYEICLPKRHRRYALQLKPDGRYHLEQYKDRNDRHDFLAAARVVRRQLRFGVEVSPL
jgi:hypothetical protein